ncbi:hypothetical protein P8A24_07090 [Arcanobacterium wilhelmae]|uniref:hypothetical protein n=1 Tax=Arcanobacterium wilhelmae TaxID=1803177 RepID=UPI002414E38A|nr:hypothetical protein [Arcanobacterium wilhelmae]WFN89953.1 hypothetical protein P8A24_07090 [Arcanobacterium wilhelmae]
MSSASVLGIRRLLEHIDLYTPGEEGVIVVNQVRSSSVGHDPSGQISRLLVPVRLPSILIRDDAAKCDAALLRGESIVQRAPKSAASKDIVRLWEFVRDEMIGGR